MELAVKIIEALVPLVIAALQHHYPEKDCEEHKKLAGSMIHDYINGVKNADK